MRAKRRHSLRADDRGLSTVEYVIVLVVVGLVGIAAWRVFGANTTSRALESSQEVGALGESVDGPARSAGGGSRAGTQGRRRVEDATAEETPPPSAREEFFGPVMLLSGAVLLVLAVVAKRILRKGDGGKGGGGGSAGKT